MPKKQAEVEVIKCCTCKTAIVVIDKDGDVGPTMNARTLHVIGGDALYCCKMCGAAQILSRGPIDF